MSGKYKQIPIGAHRIKIKEHCFEKEEFLEADNNLNLTELFMRDYGSLEKNLEEAKMKIFKKGFDEHYNLKQSKNKVYWDVEKIMEFSWKGYKKRKITHKHFGSDPVRVYAIKLTNI